MGYTTSYYHIIITTYRRRPTICEKYENELYAYLCGIVKNHNSKLLAINGMPEHVHLFVRLSPSISLATFMQQLKGGSSKWLKRNPHFPKFKGWGHEYAAFSYSVRDKDMIVNYIKRQKSHHNSKAFATEYVTLVKSNCPDADIKE